MRVQLEARRLRLFDLDVFFFGTAIVSYSVGYWFSGIRSAFTDGRGRRPFPLWRLTEVERAAGAFDTDRTL